MVRWFRGDKKGCPVDRVANPFGTLGKLKLRFGLAAEERQQLKSIGKCGEVDALEDVRESGLPSRVRGKGGTTKGRASGGSSRWHP